MSAENLSHGTPGTTAATTTATYDELAARRDIQALRLRNSRIRVALFKGLQDENTFSRAAALKQISGMVKMLCCRETESASETLAEPDGLGGVSSHRGSVSGPDSAFFPPQDLSTGASPQSAGTPIYPERSGIHVEDEARLDRNEQLQHYLLTALRLSQNCPFRDVRSHLRTLLRRIRRKHGDSIRVPMSIYPSPSFFIPVEDLYSIDFPYEEKANISQPTNPLYSHTGLPRSPTNPDLLAPQEFDTDRISVSSTNTGGGGGSGKWNQDASDSDSDTSSVKSSSSASSATTSTIQGRPAPYILATLAVQAYITSGRISNSFRVLSFFPTYLERHEKVLTCLLRTTPSPLPRPWRNYVALMAAAGKGCQYLVSLQKHEFLHHGGDPTWLRGLAHTPKKLRALASLARTLACAPWTLRSEDIKALRRPHDPTEPGEAWTAAELVHAVVILASFNAYSTFILACGVVPEADTRGGYYLPDGEGDPVAGKGGVEAELVGEDIQSPSGEEDLKKATASIGWEANDVARMTPSDEYGKGRGANNGSGTNGERDDYFGIGAGNDTGAEDADTEALEEEGEEADYDEDDEDRQHENEEKITPRLRKNTQKIIKVLKKKSSNLPESGDIDDESGDQATISFGTGRDLRNALSLTGISFRRSNTGNSTPSSSIISSRPDGPRHIRPNAAHEDLSRFLDQDLPPFPPSARETKPTQLDYSWEEYGSEMASRYLPDLGRLIDDELTEARQFTDWTLFDVRVEEINTGPLRDAIWIYALRFTRVESNEDSGTLLTNRTRAYIKKVLERPSKIKRSDWNDMGLDLRSEEKCHVNLLVAEARKLAELGYGVGAVVASEERQR